jgi:hypothetical protein
MRSRISVIDDDRIPLLIEAGRLDVEQDTGFSVLIGVASRRRSASQAIDLPGNGGVNAIGCGWSVWLWSRSQTELGVSQAADNVSYETESVH